MAHPVNELLENFTKKYRKEAEALKKLIQKKIDEGIPTEQAVKEAMKELGLEKWLSNEVKNAIKESIALGAGIKAAGIPGDIIDHWNSEDMQLSERLHGTSIEMRNTIVNTIKDTQKAGIKIKDLTTALYDGYGYDHKTLVQEIPKYLAQVVKQYRTMPLSIKDRAALISSIRTAAKKVERLAQNGAPNQNLKTSYNQLLKAMMKGNDEAVNKAIWVAVQEKSRYVAERIARTEAARAWASGFYAKYANDKSVAAFRVRLSSRHPIEDICNMYAEANLYGLGRGVFPKDKTPAVPVHPHCLCVLEPVYNYEVEGKKQNDDIETSGRKWLEGISANKRKHILGVEGSKSFQMGQSWKVLARGYSAKTLGGVTEEIDLSSGQAYKTPKLGDIHEEIREKTKEMLTLQKVENATVETYVSSKVYLKPKILHELETQFRETLKLIDPISKNYPRMVILSDTEISDWGSYHAEKNTIYFNVKTLNRKLFTNYLKNTPGEVSTSHLTAMVHEMIHWNDAQKYQLKHGRITNQDEYLKKIREHFKPQVEELEKKVYNMGRISTYAEEKFIQKKYDEVMTEYRTKIILEGEGWLS